MDRAAASGAGRELGLFLDGLHCTGCVNRAERALRAVPGVLEAGVNYTDHRARVRFDPAAADARDLVGAIEALGYRATPYDLESLERPARGAARDALVRLLVAAFLAMNVMWLSVALYAGGYQDMDLDTRRALRWLVVALSVPAVTWCAWPFWRGALRGLARRELTIDVPIVLGLGTAFAVSVLGTAAESEHLYMDSAAVIVFLILLGRTLEGSARGRSAAAVDRLRALSPARALRRGSDGALVEVDSAALAVGDRVVVPAGQAVPSDGCIRSGASELDESLVTGESAPVARGPGDPVVGGSRNALEEIEIEVTAPVSAGTLARLAGLLERAQLERPRLQRAADRVAAWFAPAVLAVAGATAAGWVLAGAAPLEVALSASAVLIVACPCALGLATPAAVTSAIGRAARLGLWVKSGAALERCAGVDAVVLDKTGTVSEGRFALAALACAPSVEESDLLRAAVETEGASTHPVAEAVRRAAAERGLPDAGPGERRSAAGRGVEALCAGETLRAGSLAFLRAAGVEPSPSLLESGDKLAERGLTLVWVARGDRALGVLAFWDPPREDAAATVARWLGQGLRVELLSGDHAGAVSRVASRTGIPHASSEVSPEQKVGAVRRLRAAGHRVLAAGDGINDAAALGAADVGVAMATGADVTLHAADVVVRAPRLGALSDLRELSGACLARIRENLGFAVAYNAVAVPLAAAGFLEPLHAAVAMSLSSVIVTANAVRLLRWRPRP